MTSKNAAKRRRHAVSKWKKRAAVKRGTKFDRKLVSITEKVLKQVFGEDATASICDYLERNYRLKLDDIPDKPEVFSKALESYLDSGATVIERIILENLYSNSGVKLKRVEEKTFPQRLSELKRVYGA
jgi:hypothetical protein